MPKLRIIFLSSGSKMQFNQNKCIVKNSEGKLIAITLYKGNLYHMNFIKVHGAVPTNLVQTLNKDHALEFWHHYYRHLNMKSVHVLQNMISGMNLGNKKKIRHLSWFVKCALRLNNVGQRLPTTEEATN